MVGGSSPSLATPHPAWIPVTSVTVYAYAAGKVVLLDHARIPARLVLFLAFALIPLGARCGAPFQTDDPGVAAAGQVDLLAFYQRTLAGATGSGSAPGVEVHWGISDGLELDVASSLAFATAPDSGRGRGYGDTTLGLKYRLVDEASGVPMVSLVPKLTFPTGNANRGLGNGGTRALLGIAAQKQRGPWQTYANLAYAIDNGPNNRNFWFAGAEVQRELSAHWIVGAEIFGMTAQSVGQHASTGFNLGGYYLVDERHQALFSLGRGLTNVHETNRVSAYVGYQISF